MARYTGILPLLLLWLRSSQATPKNVMFIMVDDMRPDTNFYRANDPVYQNYTPLYTPNLDKLAASSLVLKRAYCQVALCAPSRTSLLVSRRPDITHVHELGPYWRDVSGNFTTIPQYFKENGYMSIGMGKIFHPGTSSANDDPISWTEPYYQPSNKAHYASKDLSWYVVSTEDRNAMPLPDDQTVQNAISRIQSISQIPPSERQPFFMGVGLLKPHLPFVFPEDVLQYYPDQIIEPPGNPYAPAYLPTIAWSKYGELRGYQDIQDTGITGDINTTLPDSKVHDLRKGYFASITYIDQLIGELITAIDDAGMSNDTIVVVLGDHGFQVGEHGSWAKHTNFEISASVPLMLHVPGRTDNGIVTDAFVELVDVFPTLVEAAGLPDLPLCAEGQSLETIACHEGHSMMPLIDSPNTYSGKSRVFFQYKKGSVSNPKMGYSMLCEKYHFTEWVGFTGEPDYMPIWEDNYGTELYDRINDPHENYNLAHEEQYATLVSDLHTQLRDGWRAALP